MDSASSTRVLVVADWTVDPHAVVAAVGQHRPSHEASFAILVPAWLHGLDWVGDPAASVPCALWQLERVVTLCRAAGLPIDHAQVGDPDVVTAITDAHLAAPVDEILLCVRHGRLDLSARAARATGVMTRHVALPAARSGRRTRPWEGLRRGHCAAAAA